jgi:hypothetical protein
MTPNAKVHALLARGRQVTLPLYFGVVSHFRKPEAVEAFRVRVELLVFEYGGVGGKYRAALGDMQTVGEGVIFEGQPCKRS